MNFLTHRDTQPVSRWTRDLVVKSSIQDSKQWLTRPENIYKVSVSLLINDHVSTLALQGTDEIMSEGILCLPFLCCSASVYQLGSIPETR
jgi:hypothetical protein